MACSCSFDDWEQLSSTLRHPSFQVFASDAYAAPDGYSIRINPETGKREMFIAGTRSPEQWILNIYDMYIHHRLAPLAEYFDPFRYFKQRFYASIIDTEKIQIVYGHSRGGALVADMNITASCVQRVGLDSAMVLAKNRNMLNIYEGGTGVNGVFDEFIGIGGQRNVSLDHSPDVMHKVWYVDTDVSDVS